MWRQPRKLSSKLGQADAVAPLELGFTDAVLFHVVIRTEANHPAVGGLESHATVSAVADVSTFARVIGAAWY
jgi:hypothetical protein